MQNTDIIILDEPYSSLDYKSKLDNYAILLDLVQSQSKTIIIITHDLDEALYISDYVVTLFPHRQ